MKRLVEIGVTLLMASAILFAQEDAVAVNAKNPAGRTPLAETTWHKATAAAKLLVAAGAK